MQNNPNFVLECIHTRRSVRHFRDGRINESILLDIVKAGMAAPSAVNKQPWAFTIVTEKSTLDMLGDALPYAKMLHTASAAIVVCGQPDIGISGPRSEMWIQDCSAATQNILLAAESYDLGAVLDCCISLFRPYGTGSQNS